MKRRRQAVMLLGLCMGNAALLGACLSVYQWFYGNAPSEARIGVEAGAPSADASGEAVVPPEASDLMEASMPAKASIPAGRDGDGPSKKQIALTFDDGPHPVYTIQLLDGLKERGVKATFFLIGKNIDGNEGIVRRMHEEGHLIGNHSNTHVQLNVSSDKEACQEIEAANRKIYDVTGEQTMYIRPPFGSWSDELECLVPMTVVLWNIDPLDWKVQNTRKVAGHILKHADDGSIVLLHDSYPTSVEAALEVIDTLTRQGYTFVTVDELMID